MPFTGNFTCNTFKVGILDGTFDFGTGTTDVFKIALYTNAASLNQDTAAYTSDGEVVATGYTAGGEVLQVSQVPTTGSSGSVSYLSFSNVTWNAALTARGALIYKNGGGAVCVLDFGNDKTSTTTFTVQFPAPTNTSAIIRIS
jgi:hypothetical protein